MNRFEKCTYLGELCGKRGKCLIESTMRNQMTDGKSWLDPTSKRVKEKITDFLQAAKMHNCQNQEALENLVAEFQAGKPSRYNIGSW